MKLKWWEKGYRSLRNTAGFTLLELLVVLAILALLAGLVGPRVLKQLSAAKSSTARIQIKNIESTLDLFLLDMGHYPTTQEGLNALLQRPGDAEKWRGPYLRGKDGLIDPWGAPYLYRKPGRDGEFDVFSLGADGTEGGEGENRDIGN